MNQTDKINKLITYLFIIGLSLCLIFVYFAQERVYSETTIGNIELGSERYFRSIGVVFIFLTVFLSLFAAKGKYLAKIFVAYLVLLAYITISYLITGPGIDDITALMDSKGIGPWIAFGLIFVGYHDKRYDTFKKFLILSVFVITAYVIYNLKDFGIGSYRGQSLAKYRVFATNLVWITPYIFLSLKDNKKLKYVRIFAIAIGIITAILTQTRSFLLVYFLVFAFDFYRANKKALYTIAAFILGGFFIYFILTSDIFSTSFELLQRRGFNDTRSNQLSQFLSQINVFELVVGKGFEASWNFGGETYAYLDNQWLYLLWWAGLIPAMAYFYLTAIIPFKMYFRKDQDYQTKLEAFVIILWTLACAGLSIYSTMSVDYYFFTLCVIQGRLLYKYSLSREV